MRKGKIVFEWTDAWLLISIATASKSAPAELWEIIAEGDYINRAIFTESELRDGLYRLLVKGWITENKNKFETTEKYMREIKPRLSGSHYAQVERIFKILCAESQKARKYTDNNSRYNLKYSVVSPKAFTQAIKKYHKEFLK